MKKIIFFIAVIFLTGCSSDSILTSKKTQISCPSVLFSNQHNIYIDSNESPLSLDNIAYQAKINNFSFTKGCFSSQDISILSVLFVVYPKNNNKKTIFLPFYVATVDSEDNFLNIQYYEVEGKFDADLDTNQLKETELIKKIDLPTFINGEKNKIIIGFMLDKQRVEILN